ncbi:phosphotransferase family protein [Jatrophihabitans sp. DSM 45814]
MTDGEDLDAVALDTWIADQLPAAGEPVSVERIGMGSGTANALYFLKRGEHQWVLRRPPTVKTHSTASDTLREWRILTALEGTDVPHPAPRVLCEDPSILGVTFMIMDKVVGFTPGAGLEPPFTIDPAARWDMAMAYVDGLVELSGVDWQKAGLGELGKPHGFLERQVTRWLGQLEEYRSRELPEVEFLCGWLEGNRPSMSPAAILHGDYSPFNVMVAPDLPARLSAIIDWDTGTIGDPLLDIGHLLARWTEPGEEPILGPPAGGVEHYPTRGEMAWRYAERTGRDLAAIAYYQALALFKLGVILEGHYARARAGGVPDVSNSMTTIVPRLFRGAAAFARGERI